MGKEGRRGQQKMWTGIPAACSPKAECQLATTCCWLRVGCEYNRGDEPLGEELSDKSLMNENMK